MKTKELEITGFSKSFKGYGHNKVTITVTGVLIDDEGTRDVYEHELSCVTNNTMATDAYFDEHFDENLENIGSFYESRYEAGESLVDEIFRVNGVESSYEITTVPTQSEVDELREQIKQDNEQ